VPPLTRADREPDPAAGLDDVARAAGGDLQAFERLYRTHAPRVHSLARRMAGGQDADDLTQDIFVRVWQKVATFRGDSSFATWLHRLAVNVIVERFRSKASERKRFADVGDQPPEAVAPRSSPTDRLGLEDAVERLPDGARRVFVLHDVHGYRHQEIASMLDVSVGTTKAQLHRARMLMRRRLR